MVPGASVRYDSNITTTPWVAALAQQSSVEAISPVFIHADKLGVARLLSRCQTISTTNKKLDR